MVSRSIRAVSVGVLESFALSGTIGSELRAASILIRALSAIGTSSVTDRISLESLLLAIAPNAPTATPRVVLGCHGPT